MLDKLPYQFKAEVWKHNSSAGWYFVTLPKNTTKEIRLLFQKMEEGWGRLPCDAKIGKTRWKSALWFDTKHNAYILPLKAEVRKKEHIELNKQVFVFVYL